MPLESDHSEGAAGDRVAPDISPNISPNISTDPGTDAAVPGDGSASHWGLAPAQRERIAAELQRLQIGDAIDRKLFLATLDYEVAALARRLQTAGIGAWSTPDAADGARSGLATACVAAASGLDAAIAADAERVCLGFIGELARAFDDCFELPPTTERGGAFVGILTSLRDACGLPLSLDAGHLRKALGQPVRT